MSKVGFPPSLAATSECIGLGESSANNFEGNQMHHLSVVEHISSLAREGQFAYLSERFVCPPARERAVAQVVKREEEEKTNIFLSPN